MGLHESTRGLPSPLVESVTKHKGEWTIHPTVEVGRTSNQDREMWVPLDDDVCHCGKSHSDWVRTHELYHTKLSPAKKTGAKLRVGDKVVEISVDNVEVAEEFRVNWSLTKVEGMEAQAEGSCRPAVDAGVASYMDRGEYTKVVHIAVAGGPGETEEVVEALKVYERSLRTTKPSSPEAAKSIEKKLKVAKHLRSVLPAYEMAGGRIMGQKAKGYRLPRWSDTLEFAAFLEINLKSMAKDVMDLLTDDPPPSPDLDAILTVAEKKVPGPPMEVTKVSSRKGEPTFAAGLSGDPDSVEWGKNFMITEAPLTRSLPPWKLQKVNRAVEEGTIPRYMHRWPSDKRVFVRSKRLPGGSILVDDSGSMGLSAEDLDHLIEVAPVATIAVYSGVDGGNGGEIRVVARNGKRTTNEHLQTVFGGNGIDGPAVEWLGTQPDPRIWVTDGGVSSKSHGFDSTTRLAAKNLCRKHKVSVVRSAEEAVKMLKSGKFAR